MRAELETRVAAYMRKQQMVKAGDTIAVALSGGADSVCLFRLLLNLRDELDCTVEAVHVNHGLRPEAEAEEAWVRDLCARAQVPLYLFHVNVRERVEKERCSVEEAARDLRYECFEAVLADRIALAHHRRDQAETVLQHLLRGSGLQGLGGMRPVRGRYIRPLLDESAETLRAYNQAFSQTWMEDASNRDCRYMRNRIRHQLLPELSAEYNPAIEEALARMAVQLQRDEDYLEAQARKALADVRCDEGLYISRINALPDAVVGRVLRMFVKEQGVLRNLSFDHVEQIKDLCRTPGNRRINLPEGLTFLRSYDILKPYKETSVHPPVSATDGTDGFLIEHIPTWVEWPGTDYGIGLEWREAPTPDQWKQHGPDEEWMRITPQQLDPHRPLTFRTRRSGDYLMASGGRKRLQDYFVDRKIPAEQRDSLWLLTLGSHVLWIPRYRLSDGARITTIDDTQTVLHVWLCTNEEYKKRP